MNAACHERVQNPNHHETARINHENKTITMKPKYLIIPALILALVPGCVTRTTVKNEPRQHVQFAGQHASETFYEAYLATYYPSNRKSGTVVWVGLPYTHHKISMDNVYFNIAIKSADANHDGIISDEEATGYAQQRKSLFEQPQKADVNKTPPLIVRARGD